MEKLKEWEVRWGIWRKQITSMPDVTADELVEYVRKKYWDGDKNKNIT